MISKTDIHEKINYFSLALIAFSMPFEILFCTYAIALFVLNQLLEGKIIQKLKSSLRNKFVVLFAGFYVLYILSVIFSDNIARALFELERKSPILIFPLLLFTLTIRKEQVRTILLSFILSCFLLGIIMLVVSFYRYLQDGNPYHFLLENLSSATGIHRVYASMYFLFCILTLLYFQESFSKQKKIVWLFYFLIAFFCMIIFLLSSRMMTSLTVISFLLFSFLSIFRRKNILKGVFMISFILLLSGSFILFGEKFRDVLSQTYTGLDLGNSEHNHTGPNQRIEIWKASLEIIQKNPFGVGSGDVEETLVKQYEENKFKWGILYKFNAHNQYLETFISLGIAGFLYFLSMLFLPFLTAFRKNQYLFCVFLILFSFACLTESMLNTQKGIVFYAFFNSLLFFHSPDKNQ